MATLPSYWDESLPEAEMQELEVQLYSKSQIAGAGKLLAGTIDASRMNDDEVRQAFKIAWNWRNSHIYPMRKLRAELSNKARRVNSLRVAAARPKRMRSIRQKLDPRSLYDIQDIAGCRVIMPSMGDVRGVLDAYAESAKHTLHRPYDYIGEPRDTGYRCYHLVYKFDGADDEEREAFKHHYVEVQLRTQLQHSWATAVEAVGLVRNEDLKHGRGDADWLRFFALMSSEFAREEGSTIVPGTPADTKERRKEIKELDNKLDAIKSLDGFRRIIDKTAKAEASRGTIFLIQYDPVQGRVNVKTVPNFKKGSADLGTAEAAESGKSGRRIETVLVEVDAASDLRQAYPNYYLDVGEFVERVRRIVSPPKKDLFKDWWEHVRVSRSSKGR
jgi:hypothetical protein